MKFNLLLLSFLQLSLLLGIAQDQIRVNFSDLEAVTLKSDNLLINNFNVHIGDAILGGKKATAQCTGNNKNDDSINYTIYIAAFDQSENLIACFNLEPVMNTHEAGKIETLETSGMVSSNSKNIIDHLNIKLVIQK